MGQSIFILATREYPGSGCLNFALFEDAKYYGVTAHHMNEKIDDGDIIMVKKFPISRKDNVESLLKKTHIELYNLFCKFILLLKKDKFLLNKIKLSSNKNEWGPIKRRIKDVDKLAIVNPNMDEKEIKHIIRATYTKKYPTTLKIHGLKFEFKNKII